MRVPELWGGLECSVNRIRDTYRDQTVLSGHQDRIEDLERFAEIGFRALRYPVLWERVAGESLEKCDWRWSDVRLKRIRSLGMRPIVGLLHHGSGPRYTDLLDEQFPAKLAAYARKVAERYPWADAYTPVNEPLTTARFSALYGFWYPHACDDRSFLRALFNEVMGTILAMRTIREVNPKAELIHTEDLAKVFSTEKLQYQADFENDRRWLSLDLLCGKVNREHALWKYMTKHGLGEGELERLAELSIVPNICGFNHYLSGERFLDERIDLYPGCPVGGNGRESYVDVLAARALPDGMAGAGRLLTEAWERYRLPLALTEVHNGCTREEQVRWLVEQWNHCCALLRKNIDVRAFTVWTLLGSYDWNSLLTVDANFYEPGVFDLRSPEPRATAIAKAAKALGRGETPEHPMLQSVGWWHRPSRFHVRPARTGTLVHFNAFRPRPILITDSSTLGKAFARICCDRGLRYVLFTRNKLDVADRASVERAIEQHRPWAIINTLDRPDINDAETVPNACYRENVMGTANLAELCAAEEMALVNFSSDCVFEGKRQSPYVESDLPNPVGVYGICKLKAEEEALKKYPQSLVIRSSSALFGPWEPENFVTRVLRGFAPEEEFANQESVLSPTYIPDLVNHALDLLLDGESGIWHLANSGHTTWADLAAMIREIGRVKPQLTLSSAHLPAPTFRALTSEKAWIMPHWADALRRFFRECNVAWNEPTDEEEVIAA